MRTGEMGMVQMGKRKLWLWRRTITRRRLDGRAWRSKTSSTFIVLLQCRRTGILKGLLIDSELTECLWRASQMISTNGMSSTGAQQSTRTPFER